MTLSDTDIADALADGHLVVRRDGAEEPSIEPSSIDLHLAGHLLVPKPQSTAIDVTDESTYPQYSRRHSLTVRPREFALATTEEWVGLSNRYVGFLHGRSSVGRLGMFIHNAGLVDADFEGQLTLELFNPLDTPIKLADGMRIAQLTVHPHDTPAVAGYAASRGNKYNRQLGPTPSRLYEDFE